MFYHLVWPLLFHLFKVSLLKINKVDIDEHNDVKLVERVFPLLRHIFTIQFGGKLSLLNVLIWVHNKHNTPMLCLL